MPVQLPFYFRRWTSILTDIVSLLLGLCSLGKAADHVTMEWDPNTESDIAGYLLHYGTASGVYTETIDVGNATTVTVSHLTPGTTYFFTVTAYDTARLESPFSGEVAFTATPNDPPKVISSLLRLSDGSMQLTLTNAAGAPVALDAIDVYVSSDLKVWTLLSHLLNPAGTLVVNDPDAAFVDRRFYRLAVP